MDTGTEKSSPIQLKERSIRNTPCSGEILNLVPPIFHQPMGLLAVFLSHLASDVARILHCRGHATTCTHARTHTYKYFPIHMPKNMVKIHSTMHHSEASLKTLLPRYPKYRIAPSAHVQFTPPPRPSFNPRETPSNRAGTYQRAY